MLPAFVVGDQSVTAMEVAPGQWSAPIAGATGVLYTSPDLVEHDLESGTADTRASFIAFEHADPQPAPGASITLDVTLPATHVATDTVELAVIGAWSTHTLTPMEAPIGDLLTATIPYTSFIGITAAPPTAITTDDVVLVLQYSAGALTGVLQVPGFAQSATSADALTGAMTAVTAATPFDATIDPPAIATRFAALQPAEATLAQSWNLTASPGYAVGTTTGVSLVSGAIAMTDTTFAGSYTDPFTMPAWPPMLTYVSSESRTATLGGVTVSLGATLATIVDPAAGLVLDSQAGLATVALATMPLVTDGMTVMLDPTLPLEIALTPDAPSTWFAVTVVDIAIVNTAVTRTPIIQVAGPAPLLTLPANALQAGHTYTLATTCISGGFVDAAAGDLQTFALPISFGEVDSAVFTVVAP